jgi:hypothetical protein
MPHYQTLEHTTKRDSIVDLFSSNSLIFHEFHFLICSCIFYRSYLFFNVSLVDRGQFKERLIQSFGQISN